MSRVQDRKENGDGGATTKISLNSKQNVHPAARRRYKQNQLNERQHVTWIENEYQLSR